MYLNEETFLEIQKQVKLVEFDNNYRINDFDSGYADFNEFLTVYANECMEENVCVYFIY